MNETRVANVSDAATNMNPELQHRLDALVRRERSVDEFVDEILTLVHGAPDSAWNIVALIHQRYRHGEISADVFRSIVSTIVGRALDPAHSATIDQTPLAGQPAMSIDVKNPISSVEIGRVLRDRYVIDKRLGSGRTGTVFKALDRHRSDSPKANQYVAIKILHEGIHSRLELLANLRCEFYTTQMLSHRNIVKVYELDQDGDLDFFTMEFLEGELLSDVRERLRPMPMYAPYAWAIIRQIGAGLVHAHARNVVHADLQPHNIMITNSGEVQLLGFGESNSATTLGLDGVSCRRNAAYACCELLAGRSAEPSDDIYALACLSYELLAGTHPFEGRPSTLARDLGIVPTRPPGLTRQQWLMLAMGLSWHRAGRSISIRAWLNKLNTDRLAVRQLPAARELKPAPAIPRRMAFLRAASLFAVLLITIAVWASFSRLAPGGKVSGDDVVRAVPANMQLNSDPVATINSAGPDGKTLAESRPRESRPTSVTTETHSQLSSQIRRDADRSKLSTAMLSPIIVSSRNYRIRQGEHFAEIHVYRSSRSRGDTAFVWWTEAASAKPGIDYVRQANVTQSFPKGKSSTSLFIKLLPKASRTQREVFYVAIAEAGRGASSGQIAHAAIWLPTTHDHW